MEGWDEEEKRMIIHIANVYQVRHYISAFVRDFDLSKRQNTYICDVKGTGTSSPEK
jgi:hypothetical protein